ncbi:hypothetical protein W727_01820 [Staphylococcus aureus VET1880R]|nr:hypothetical protein W727_01820 [Staphylococcus aureus VET1880R]
MSIMRLFTFILSIFIVGMVEMMVAGIMNLMSQDLHVSEAVVGQLVTMYALTFAICGPILVKLTNRFHQGLYYYGHYLYLSLVMALLL